MLQDYRELATELKTKFLSIQNWPEIKFDIEDVKMISKIKGVFTVYDHSIQFNISPNLVIIPSQYILYAICVKELAISLKNHVMVLEDYKKNHDLAEHLAQKTFDLESLTIDDYSKSIAFKPFTDNTYNFEAKSFLNGQAGNYKLRGASDFFGSVILKLINVPDASSSILGRFIFELADNIEVYNYLEKKYLWVIPYITKESTLSKFVKNVFLFLMQSNEFGLLSNLLTKNGDPSFLSIKDGELSLTSIFKCSYNLLSEEDLTQGSKIRFLKAPLYFDQKYGFQYLSTEWTFDRESRLDLTTLKKILNKYYPQYEIVASDGVYYFKCKTSKFNSDITSDINLIRSFIIDLPYAGLQYDEKLVIRFISALITKPFVILTGLSGSGKTKLAQAFVEWLCEDKSQFCIVPVGADWTNREPLLGFPNSLTIGTYVKPDNRVLDTIIAATNDSKNPYFLILDEMNLSHVERYFADFLSTMESEDEISMHASNDSWNGVPAKISLPKNLFVVGTVNIDETTYMFSPKVLDRANVIEFRVTAEEMKSYLKEQAPLNLKVLKKRGTSMAADFIQIANNKTLSVKDDKLIKDELINFFTSLKVSGAEFGYRSAAEILRFAGVVNLLEPAWSKEQILDAAIMQKLLPKVHGSRRKLEPVLKTLGKLCFADDSDTDKYFGTKVVPDAELVKYPISLEKILRMYNGLIDNGFTSYAEA